MNTLTTRTIIAFLLLVLGLISVIDWIIFSTEKLNQDLGWDEFKQKYTEHLPLPLQPLYQNPVLITAILIFCFVASGLLFLSAKRKAYFALAIFCFVLAFWQLFSLM
jgi:hypothetical protein